MANEVEIIVTSKDRSGPGVQSAKKEVTGFRASVADAGKTLKTVFGAAIVAEGARRLVTFFNDSKTAATNLNESVNAVDKVFKGSADGIRRWGEQNANSLGLTRAQFNQSSAVIGAMLKNADLSLKSTSDWTKRITERSADMASVFNTDVSQAMDAWGALLRGETEQMEAFGVSIKQSDINARALADTGKTNEKALTDQEKATAALSLAMEQTNDVAGDFRDTSGELANKERILAAKSEELKTKIGEHLLPVYDKIYTKLLDDVIPEVHNFIDVTVGGSKKVGDAVERHLKRTNRNLDNSVQSFSDFSKTWNNRTLSWGERFGLIWNSVFTNNAKNERSQLEIMKRINGLALAVMTGRVDRFGGEINNLFGGAWRRVSSNFRSSLNRIGSNLSSQLFVLRLMWSNGLARIRERTGEWGSNLVNWFKGLPGRIGEAVGNIGATIKRKFSDLFKGFKIPINLAFGGDGLGIGAIGSGGGGLMGVPESATVAQAYRAIGSPGDVTSGYRPGAITSTGNPSYHGAKRALDFSPLRSAAVTINALFKSRTKELITPWQELNIHNGRRHSYSAGVYALHSGSNAHNHWAMRHGGIAPGGWTWLGENGPELAKLPSGTQVKTSGDSARIVTSSNPDNPIVIQLILDGKTIASASFDPLRRELKSRGLPAVLG